MNDLGTNFEAVDAEAHARARKAWIASERAALAHARARKAWIASERAALARAQFSTTPEPRDGGEAVRPVTTSSRSQGWQRIRDWLGDLLGGVALFGLLGALLFIGWGVGV